MKKFLLLVILLLTLLPLARVSAQDMINENGYKCYDDGIGYYISPIPCDAVEKCESQCSSCDAFFDCDEIEEHEKNCYYECTQCNKQMTIKEMLSHSCEPKEPDINQNCVFCGMPLDQCICPGPIANGNAPSSGGGGTGGGGGGAGGGGGGGSKPWKVGDYLKPNGCQVFFKNQIMIMPQQEDTTDCVSATLANCAMWQNDYPIEKYDSVKKAIEKNIEKKIGRSIKLRGVNEAEFDEVIPNSGLQVTFLSPTNMPQSIEDGVPFVTDVLKFRYENNKKYITSHFISVVGYDKCKNVYLCIDPQQKKIVEYDLATLQLTGFLYQIIK